MNYICSIFWDLRNLQEQVKKAFCYQKLFLPFIVWIYCSSGLKHFANSLPSASNFKSFPQSLEQFCLTKGRNNFETREQSCSKFIIVFLLHSSLNWAWQLSATFSVVGKWNQLNIFCKENWDIQENLRNWQSKYLTMSETISF